VIGWTTRVLNQIVEITIDDEMIEYRRRTGPALVISISDVIDSEVGPSLIRFRYKGPLDVQSNSIPLRRFQSDEVEVVREIFSQKRPAQQAGSSNGG